MVTLMTRVNLYLKKTQIKFLKNFNGLSVSEHVRRALDQYIDKLKSDKVSASRSKREVNYSGQ